jgi:tetratricopeptide (TPR) repeat protein
MRPGLDLRSARANARAFRKSGPGRVAWLAAGALCVGLYSGGQTSSLDASPRVQHGDEHAVPDDFDEPIRLYADALGTFTRPISSSSTQAKAYFNQGFRLMYAFARAEAGRSFREAQKRDPTCAICYWGEAWAWGSYLNRQMTVREAPRAYAAIQKAMALATTHASPTERVFIQAMAVRYVASFDPAKRVQQDFAYAQAMGRVAEAYPADLDAATLYAEALFLLLPRPGAIDLNHPVMLRVLRVLEGALARDMRHTGACHFYVHATELTTRPDKAESCAEFLGSSMPGASHINHMPSHTWSKVGRWGDAVRASLQAWRTDQKAAQGQGVATYPEHDLQMLAFAASMDGQGAVAIQAGRDYATVTGNSMYRALTLIRFGRFDAISSIGDRPKDDIGAAMWDFAQGYAALRLGDAGLARRCLDRVLTAAESASGVFKIHPARPLLGTVSRILEGEIHRAAGDLTSAVSAFERAVSFEDSLVLDEPEPLPFAARHWLGAALLEAGRTAEAERAYSADLVRHPHNGWSLVGLQRALEAQGKSSSAVEADFRVRWARADTPIRASRF